MKLLRGILRNIINITIFRRRRQLAVIAVILVQFIIN